MGLRLCLLLCFFVLVACGPSRMSTGPTVPTVVQVTNEPDHRFVAMSDLETVHDVHDASEYVWVATDLGLYRHPRAGAINGARSAAKKAEWLPSGAVRTVLASRSGALFTGMGDVVFERGTDGGVLEHALGATVHDLAQVEDTLFACTARGVARRVAGSWDFLQLGIGACDAFFEAPDRLWIVAEGGQTLIELSEGTAHAHQHALRELTEEGLRVQSVVELGGGEALALLRTQGHALLARYHEGRWITYTSLPFDGAVLGLAGTSRSQHAWLATTGGHFLVDLGLDGEGVPAVAVAVGKPERVVSWKAVGSSATGRSASNIDQTALKIKALHFLEAPTDSPDAPELRFRLLGIESPDEATTVFSARSGVLLAPPHRGVARQTEDGVTSRYETQSLIPTEGTDYRLSLATGPNGPMLRTASGELAVLTEGRLVPVAVPDGVTISSLASQGAALIGAGPSSAESETALSIYAYRNGGFEATREVELGAHLAEVHRLGLSAQGDIWAAIRIRNDDGSVVPRGVVWLPAGDGEPVPFHSGIEVVEGAASKPAPDNVFDLDLGQGGFAWLATFAGAVRIGDDQVIVFGQARGVPGESVFDIRASDERMWLVAAGGLGTYDNRDLDFRMPEAARRTRATRVATHSDQVWVAGPGGIARRDGGTWHEVDLSGEVLDIDIDATGRIWLLFQDQLWLIEPTRR